MKYALVDGVKAEAKKGAKGLCQCCHSELMAKCGEWKAHHWAHKSKRDCDIWWENEGPWHRAWKEKFPEAWQEVIHQDVSGERHIADVKTESGWVIELQHSFLNPEERRSRSSFYPKLVWIVDGMRRKRDRKQFENAIGRGRRLPGNIPIFLIYFPNECTLLREWRGNNGLVFLDFYDEAQNENSKLWMLFPETSGGDLFVSVLSRVNLIELHNTGSFDNFFENTVVPIAQELENGTRARRESIKTTSRTRRSGFEQYVQNNRRRKRNFRF